MLGTLEIFGKLAVLGTSGTFRMLRKMVVLGMLGTLGMLAMLGTLETLGGFEGCWGHWRCWGSWQSCGHWGHWGYWGRPHRYWGLSSTFQPPPFGSGRCSLGHQPADPANIISGMGDPLCEAPHTPALLIQCPTELRGDFHPLHKSLPRSHIPVQGTRGDHAVPTPLPISFPKPLRANPFPSRAELG